MSNEAPPLVYIMPAEVQDEAVLWLMLTYAASMGEGGAEQVATAQSDPFLMTYVSGWGLKKGDVGVVARDAPGNALGAAWLRLGGGGGQFKLSDDDVPELATAVIPAARGRGVGTALMKRLIALATPHFRRIVLSVREENPAVPFYSRLGFRAVSTMKNRVGGNSLVMALDLVPSRDFAIHPVTKTEVSDAEAP